MTTIVDYALLAGAAYFDTRSEINRIPSPKGWDEYSRIPENKDTGFEASAYKKNDGSEIVISFAGTDPGEVFGDIIADLVLAAGGLSKQLCQASLAA